MRLLATGSGCIQTMNTLTEQESEMAKAIVDIRVHAFAQDITPAKLEILLLLALTPDEGHALSGLAARTQRVTASMTSLSDGLEEMGLAKKVRSTRDRRVVHMQITAAGMKKVQQIMRKVMNDQ